MQVYDGLSKSLSNRFLYLKIKNINLLLFETLEILHHYFK